ncbi:MAG TPA: hypothetical protein VIE43_04670 [Thermoanaerobaculia bacterium]|jgi:hypothetical protein|nr:hypothetical protein [Thermoanaerobaculia bacterium]
MIVVADSGPLHYLILLEQAELLHRFYGQVVVPEAVLRELTAGKAPYAVSDWLSKPPSWFRVQAVSGSFLFTTEAPISVWKVPSAIVSLKLPMEASIRIWKLTKRRGSFSWDLAACKLPMGASIGDWQLTKRRGS